MRRRVSVAVGFGVSGVVGRLAGDVAGPLFGVVIAGDGLVWTPPRAASYMDTST